VNKDEKARGFPVDKGTSGGGVDHRKIDKEGIREKSSKKVEGGEPGQVWVSLERFPGRPWWKGGPELGGVSWGCFWLKQEKRRCSDFQERVVYLLEGEIGIIRKYLLGGARGC